MNEITFSMQILRPCSLVIFIAVVLGLFLQSCDGPTSTADGDGSTDPYSQTLNPGLAANDFLDDTNFSELVVEIDYMEGFAPNQQALDSLQAFLEQRLNKSSITILEPTEIPAGGEETYSANDIRNLEEQHRTQFTETTGSDQLTAYMIIVDGYFDQSNVLGIAYYNTSNAFFGPAYDDASGSIGQPSRYLIESVSFRHEFGHTFGLVNIPGSGTDMQNDHQDEENGHHCDNDQCLMYFALETTDLFGQFVGEEIPPLDNNCILDLQANGGK